MPLKSISEDIQARRAVWQALSDLFLDTDTSLSRDWRVRELARSPYSVDELEEILITEVYPVCRGNLLSIAGEWAGNGRPPAPGRWYAVHFHRPGAGVLPSSPA